MKKSTDPIVDYYLSKGSSFILLGKKNETKNDMLFNPILEKLFN